MDESQTQNRSLLAGKLVSELQAIAEQVGVKDPKKRKKAELIDAILGIAPQPSSSPAGAPAANGAPAATPNGVRPDEAVHERHTNDGPGANGGSQSPSPPPWARGAPDHRQPPHEADSPTADAPAPPRREESPSG